MYYYVKIKHTFWGSVSKELNPNQMRLLALMMGQREDYVLRSSELGKKMGVSDKQIYKLIPALEQNGYVSKPKITIEKSTRKYTTNGYHLTPKTLQYLVSDAESASHYQCYSLDEICDKNITAPQWLIKSFLACYPEDSDVIKNIKYIGDKLNMDKRTVKKYIEIENQGQTIICHSNNKPITIDVVGDSMAEPQKVNIPGMGEKTYAELCCLYPTGNTARIIFQKNGGKIETFTF